MTLSDVQINNKIKEFEIEENIKLFNSVYGNLWPVFKLQIIRGLGLKQAKVKYRTNFYRTLSKLKVHFFAIKNYKYRIFRDFQTDFEKDEIWFSNHELRYENSENYNKYLDPFFIALSSKKTIMCEGTPRYPNNYTFPHLKGKQIININPILLKYNTGYLIKKLFCIFNNEYNSFKKTNFAETLTKHFPNCNLYSLFLEYIYFIEYYKFYTFFFSRYPNIKRTYIVAYYMTSRMAMIAVANSKNIKTIDIQHNVMSKTHYAYGLWNFIPKEGYNLLPKYFYVFSEKEKILLDEVFKKQHKVKIIENYAFKKWVSERKPKQDYKKNIILVTLQNTVISNKDFLLDALLQIQKNNKNINIVLRLHPRHTYVKEDTENTLKKEGLIFFWDENSEIYDTLSKTIVNITSFSTVVNDALLLNVPSIIYTEKGIRVFKGEIKNNPIVHSALNVNDFIEIINKYI